MCLIKLNLCWGQPAILAIPVFVADKDEVDITPCNLIQEHLLRCLIRSRRIFLEDKRPEMRLDDRIGLNHPLNRQAFPCEFLLYTANENLFHL